MPKERLELSRYCYRGILNPLRLPFRHLGPALGLTWSFAGVQMQFALFLPSGAWSLNRR